MKIPLSLKMGEWLYNHFYSVYQPLYFWYKKKNEQFEIDLIKQIIQPGHIVFDIGANIGFYTRLFSILVKENGRVFTFEPDRRNFYHLKNNTQHLTNVTIENKAVSSVSGIIKLFRSQLNVDHRTYPSDDCQYFEEIESVSIDNYVEQKNIPRVDFVKIDIQGYETFAIQGMKKTLLQNPKIKMISELWPYGLQQAGSNVNDYIQLLKSHFSKIYLINQNQLQELSEHKLYQLKNSQEHYYNIFATND
ncbi:MAG: FkbM family methyltransferase [Bacteroidia bacterium]|nr:FkbM family methyltransferase [Bacteroidia bacterium]